MFFSAASDKLTGCRKSQATVSRVEWHIRHLSLFMENTDARDPIYEAYDWFRPCSKSPRMSGLPDSLWKV